MALLTYWPYLLLIPAFALGTLLGWSWRAARQAARQTPSPPAVDASANMGPSHLTGIVSERRAERDRAQAELEALQDEMVRLVQAISTVRMELESTQKDHADLLVQLDERRSELRDSRTKLRTLHEDLRSQEEEVLTNIDASGEELDELLRLDKTYSARISRLTQQVQWQDSELQMLRQTVKDKTLEINEAQMLIEQREAELLRLTRQRKQRDKDLEMVKEQLARREAELRRLLDLQRQGNPQRADFHPPAPDADPPDRRDVTPGPPALPPGRER